MSDQFDIVSAADVKADLSFPDGKNTKARKSALRKVVSNIAINNPEMLTLYADVMHCMRSADPEIKRLSFLYIENYLKSRPTNFGEIASQLSREVENIESSTTIRAAALRTLSSIPHRQFYLHAISLIPECLQSQDPYLRKTACFAIAKVWKFAPAETEKSSLIGRLNHMLLHETVPMVVAAVVQTLIVITDSSPYMDFNLDFTTAKRLGSFLQDCPEFAQVSILDALSNFIPQTSHEAESLCDIILPGLRNTNAAIAIGTARCCLMLSHYSSELHDSIPLQIFGPLLVQLNRPPEIQYCILRNIYLLLQALGAEYSEKAKLPISTFVCKTSDLPYIRCTKIDIIIQLCTPQNVDVIIKELAAFVNVVGDRKTQSKAIKALSRVGSMFPDCIFQCLQNLQPSLKTHPETVAATVNLVRRYPQNKPFITEALTAIKPISLPSDEEARCAYLWLISTYVESPTQDDIYLFKSLLARFSDETTTVQTTILTCCVKMSLKFPQLCANQLIPQVFTVATAKSLDPDVRNRAFMHARVYSANPQRAMDIFAQHLPPCIPPKNPLDLDELEDLELKLGFISSLYVKPAEQLFRVSQAKQLAASPALLPRRRNVKQNSVIKPLGNLRVSKSSAPQPTVGHNISAEEPIKQSRPQIFQRQSIYSGQFPHFPNQTHTEPDDQNIKLIDI